MRYPCLIKKKDCTTAAHVTIEQEGISKYGEPLQGVEFDGLCNYQDSARTVLTAEKKLVQISGVALFRGDIAPDLPSFSGGKIWVLGKERRILQGQKARNPDGTVNYSRLDVM